jgi:hypothetical protein
VHVRADAFVCVYVCVCRSTTSRRVSWYQLSTLSAQSKCHQASRSVGSVRGVIIEERHYGKVTRLQRDVHSRLAIGVDVVQSRPSLEKKSARASVTSPCASHERCQPVVRRAIRVSAGTQQHAHHFRVTVHRSAPQRCVSCCGQGGTMCKQHLHGIETPVPAHERDGRQCAIEWVGGWVASNVSERSSNALLKSKRRHNNGSTPKETCA